MSRMTVRRCDAVAQVVLRVVTWGSLVVFVAYAFTI